MRRDYERRRNAQQRRDDVWRRDSQKGREGERRPQPHAGSLGAVVPPLPDLVLFDPASLLIDELRENMIAALKRIAERDGEEVTLVEFVRKTGVPQKLVMSKFGTWGEMRVAAGLARAVRRQGSIHYTAEDVLDALKQQTVVQGEGITLEQFRRATGISAATVWRHFGGWRNLRERAGLTRRLRADVVLSDDELLEELDRVVHQLGKMPTHYEFDRHSERCKMLTLYRRFGRKGEVVRRYEAWVRGRGRADTGREDDKVTR